MIPDFDEDGNLPVGVHDATVEEISSRFGTNAHRRKQLSGFLLAIEDLKKAGCLTVFLDGSFVTRKSEPNDYDGCWEADGVNWDELHPALQKLKWPRGAQKQRYGGEFVIADSPSEPFGPLYVDFFQQDARTSVTKGILRIDLQELP